MKYKPVPYLSFLGMHTPDLNAQLEEAASRVINSNWYILGKEVEHFESLFADYVGCKHGIGVNSGLDALIIALRCLGVTTGDEVIVASNAYIACWNAIHAVGATIVPVEPDENSYNIDASKIEDAITSRTKVIMAVHLYGRMCFMPKIMAIADKHHIYVVEDNAQAQGAEIQGRKSGSWGHINATSFYPGKNLGALGDAGIITTNVEQWARKAQALRNYGSHAKYQNEFIGMNSRMDEMQAALLSVKLKYLDQWNKQRLKLAKFYSAFLNSSKTNSSDIELSSVGASSYMHAIKERILHLDFERIGIQTPEIPEDGSHVCHIYGIRTHFREELLDQLGKKNIGTLIHYPIPPHLQKCYAFLEYNIGDFPIAERLSQEVLSLPLWPGMDKLPLK